MTGFWENETLLVAGSSKSGQRPRTVREKQKCPLNGDHRDYILKSIMGLNFNIFIYLIKIKYKIK
jgi:hypothetical protein